jgi:hypothetical protein
MLGIIRTLRAVPLLAILKRRCSAVDPPIGHVKTDGKLGHV